MDTSGCSRCFCILWFSGLFLAPAELSGCCPRGEFTCSGVCLDEAAPYGCLSPCFSLSCSISGSASSLSIPAHHLLSHTPRTFRVASTSSLSCAEPHFLQIWQESLVLCNGGGEEAICPFVPLVQTASRRVGARRNR